MAGKEEEMGSMPSGVDWREPLRMEGVEAGLPRELGMLMAAVIRAKLGEGEGMRGRGRVSWKRDMVQARDEAALWGRGLLCLHGARQARLGGRAAGGRCSRLKAEESRADQQPAGGPEAGAKKSHAS